MDELQRILAKNLKTIRDERGLSLDKLADLTLVSKSMLGQIERGISNPTLTTVWKIANGLHVSFTELIKEKEDVHDVIRFEEVSYVEEDRGKCRVYPYFTYEDGRPYEIFKVDMEPQGYIDSEPHPKGTYEMIVVHQGEVTVRIDHNEFTLKTGDATRFAGHTRHTYHNTGSVETHLSVVIYYGKPSEN